jgi:hypothetical protein
MQGLPTLVVGLGGIGLKVLQCIEERLLENYSGVVPDYIALISLDIVSDPSDGDILSPYIERHQLSLPPGISWETVLQQVRRESTPQWTWLEVDQHEALLHGITPPAQGFLPEGAYRQAGRACLFLNQQQYGHIEASLRTAMQRLFQPRYSGDFEDLHAVTAWQKLVKSTRRNIFIVGSLAGTTGAGMFIDIAAIIRSIQHMHNEYNLIGLVALPTFFADRVDASGRWFANTYAALRELDRFMRGHSAQSPYTMHLGNAKTLHLDRPLLDFCYLVDTQDYAGLSGVMTAEQGALPAMADMIVAHTDRRLGQKLNEAHTNVVANYREVPLDEQQPLSAYHYQRLRYYSALNTHTIIFPRADVARAFGCRFLLELLDSHVIQRVAFSKELMVSDEPVSVDEMLEFLSQDHPAAEVRAQIALHPLGEAVDVGPFVRLLIGPFSKTKRAPVLTPHTVLTWLIEDGHQRQIIVAHIREALREITEPVADRRSIPLYIQRVDQWLHKYLGPPVTTRDFPGERQGGVWTSLLQPHVLPLRHSSYVRLNELVIRLLNHRQAGGELWANRLNYTLALLYRIKTNAQTVHKHLYDNLQGCLQKRERLQQELRTYRVELAAYPDYLPFFQRNNPGPGYLDTLYVLAENELQIVVCTFAQQALLQLTHDLSSGKNASEPGVLDEFIQALETQVNTLSSLREILVEQQRRHYVHRQRKYGIKSRSYVTDPARFADTDQLEEALYRHYKPLLWQQLLGTGGTDSSHGPGCFWRVAEPAAIAFELVICFQDNAPLRQTIGVQPDTGAADTALPPDLEAPSHPWLEGAVQAFITFLREDAHTGVASSIWQFYQNPETFEDELLNLHRRALIRLNQIYPDERQQEHYLAINPTTNDQRVRDFYSWFATNWHGFGQQFVVQESNIDCTFLTLYHGLELEHILSFVEGETDYRKTLQHPGCLHLFVEEQHAVFYEARISALQNPDLAHVRRLHPQVIVCLNDRHRVCLFALAVGSGLIAMQSTSHGSACFLRLSGQSPVRLSTSKRFAPLGRLDHDAAHLLMSFQTWMLRGHAIDNEHIPIEYAVLEAAVQAWLHSNDDAVAGNRANLVQTWRQTWLASLSQAESQDPRFRDLGIVLLLELLAWAAE